MSIKDLPKHERPREKMLAVGVENLSEAELLAVLFRTGRAGNSVLDIAREVLKKYPKEVLLGVTYDDLKSIKGLDIGKICTLLAAFELARRALAVAPTTRPRINSIDDALTHLYTIRQKKQEHFVALYLNARNELIHQTTISVGTVNASLVHPRDVFAPALEHNATAIIVGHNHPSGDATPSPEDLTVTSRLREAGKLLGINLLFHTIVTADNYAIVQ